MAVWHHGKMLNFYCKKNNKGETIMLINVDAASILSGITKKMLQSDLNKGRLGAISTYDGKKLVNTDDLKRVYGKKRDFSAINIAKLLYKPI